MRIDRSRFNWGIFFVLLGGMAIAYRQGAVSSSTLFDAWRLWPLIVVGIGLKFVLSRTPANFVGGLLVAVTLGVVVGSAFAVGPNISCGGSRTGAALSSSGTLDANATVELTLQCGSATIGTSADGRWHVEGTSPDARAPVIDSNSSWLRVRSSNGDHWGFDRSTDNLNVLLPSGVGIALKSSQDVGDARYALTSANLTSATFDLNVGSLHVDLTGAQVGSLRVSVNLGSASVILDGSSDVTGRLSTNLGSLEVCVPNELGLKISASDSLSSSDFGDLGMVRSGGEWKTPNYDTADHKASLTFDTNLGSLKLTHAGGCK
jgi:hypothetical protein